MKKALGFVLLIGLISCQNETNFKRVVEKQFSIIVPDYMDKAYGLNDNAFLQYQNLFKELYLVALQEHKVDFAESLIANGLDFSYSSDFKGYVEIVKSNLVSIDGYNIQKDKDTLIGGMKSRMIELDGKVNGLDVCYSIVYLEGVSHYYQVFMWTLREKKKEHRKTINEILFSIKEERGKMKKKLG